MFLINSLKKIIFFGNEKFYVTIPIFFISLLPVALLSGSAIINIFIIIINIFFIFNLIINKNFLFLKNYFFYLLLFFWFSLIINLIFSNYFYSSLPRVIGFARFIILVFAIKYFYSYLNFKYEKFILTIWTFIFFVISVDLLIEYFNGQNILGYSSNFPGRLSGFLNTELKIGNFYLGFALIILTFINSLIIRKNIIIIFISILFLSISFFIGERSNFIKLATILFIFLIFFNFLRRKNIIFFLIASTIVISTIVKLDLDTYERFFRQIINPIHASGYKNYLKETQHGAHRDAAKLIFNENLLFGSGLRSFRYESAKDKYENNDYKKTMQRSSTHPHQIHWEFLSETGLFGYISFLIFFALTIYKSIKEFLFNKNLFLLACLLFIVSSIIPIFPSGSFFTTYTATIFWINYSLLITYRKEN